MRRMSVVILLLIRSRRPHAATPHSPSSLPPALVYRRPKKRHTEIIWSYQISFTLMTHFVNFVNLFASGGDISMSSARRYPTSRCERRFARDASIKRTRRIPNDLNFEAKPRYQCLRKICIRVAISPAIISLPLSVSGSSGIELATAIKIERHERLAVLKLSHICKGAENDRGYGTLVRITGSDLKLVSDRQRHGSLT